MTNFYLQEIDFDDDMNREITFLTDSVDELISLINMDKIDLENNYILTDKDLPLDFVT